MKENAWTKTILTVYKYLERVSDGIDKLVTQNALNSFYARGNKLGANGVVETSNRILELSDRKVKLVNLRVLTDEILLEMKREQAQILIEKYFDDEPGEMIAARHGLNIRTYFRRLTSAENSFTQSLLRRGFSSLKLEKYLASEKWITEVYEKFIAEENLAMAA